MPDYDDLEALDRAIADDLIDDYHVAIDGGAGSGAWASLMSVNFDRVISFESDADRCRAARAVVGGLGNVDLRAQELARRSGGLGADGGSYALAIDDLDLDRCGLIKLSVDGNEADALKGAERTLRRCRPVLIVVFAGKTSRDGHSDRYNHSYILSTGYREVFRLARCRVFKLD